MHAMLSVICSMLKSSKTEHQMAAALVLGEVAPKEPAVLKELASALATGSRPLRLAVLDALAQIGSPVAVQDLLPLLDSTDEEVRDKAARTLVRIGPAVVRPIARHILDAAPAARRGLIAVLSRVKSSESVKSLASLMESGHPDAAREAAQALMNLSQAMSKPEQARVRAMMESILRTTPDKAPAGSLSAALHVMGGIGQASGAAGVLKLTGPKYPETIRRDVLLAISGMLRGGQIPQRILSAILPIIQEGPSPALRSAALEVLATVELPASALDALLELLDNGDPAVRRFAAQNLGKKGMGGVKTVRRLVTLLSGNDPPLRDAASESLGRLPEAAALLVEELLACDDIHRGWTVAHILKMHAPRLKKAAVRSIFEKAVIALVAEDRLWEPLLYVVRHHDPKLMYDWLMEEASKFKKGRKYTEAESCLKPLTRGDHFDSEARYALALAGIKSARSRGPVSSPTSGDCMDLFRQLVRDPTFPLVDRLKKERVHLETEDLYYLGFSLAEGTPDEREVGSELLKTVAARAGGSKLGKSARNKLRAEGLAL